MSACLQFTVPAPVSRLAVVRTQVNKVEISWSRSDLSDFFSINIANVSDANASNPSGCQSE
eukprot:655259-Hanusia_phi.AAC.2